MKMIIRFGFVMITVLTLVLATVVSTQAANYAFIFGCNEFDSFSSLTGAVNDAYAYDRIFRRNGYRTVLLTNGTDMPCNRAGLVKAINDFNALLTPNDAAVFVFATHGINRNNHAWLCAQDTGLDEDSGLMTKTAVDAEALINAVQDTGVRQCTFIFDVCRSEIQEMPDEKRKPQFRLHGSLLLSGQTTVVYSCGNGERSIESAVDRRGLFSRYFCDGLEGYADYVVGDMDGNVSLFEAYAYTQKQLTKAGMDQTPMVEGAWNDHVSWNMTRDNITEDEIARFMKERKLSRFTDLELQRKEYEKLRLEQERLANESKILREQVSEETIRQKRAQEQALHDQAVLEQARRERRWQILQYGAGIANRFF